MVASIACYMVLPRGAASVIRHHCSQRVTCCCKAAQNGCLIADQGKLPTVSISASGHPATYASLRPLHHILLRQDTCHVHLVRRRRLCAFR